MPEASLRLCFTDAVGLHAWNGTPVWKREVEDTVCCRTIQQKTSLFPHCCFEFDIRARATTHARRAFRESLGLPNVIRKGHGPLSALHSY